MAKLTALQRDTLHRIRVAQSVLRLTDQRVAKAIGISVGSYQAGKLCTGAARRFADTFNVDSHWLICGEGGEIKPHLSRAKGKVVVLPVVGPLGRRWQEQAREQERKHAELCKLAHEMVAKFGLEKAREMVSAPPDGPKSA